MAQCAGAIRRKGERARFRAGDRNELLDGACRQGRMQREHIRCVADQYHGCEVAQYFVRRFRAQRGVDGQHARRCEQQRITIRRRARDVFRADRARRASPVIDDELRAHAVAELLHQLSRDDVERAARCRRHHHPHGFLRISSRGRPCRQREHGCGEQGACSHRVSRYTASW